MKIAVVLGTSNADGNTRQMVEAFIAESNASLFNLTNYDLSYYDYQHDNQEDDFLPLMRQLVGFEHIVFASPVYWYSMSAQLKVFFDRLSDLLTIEKHLGRQLKGKSCSVIATGFEQVLPACFVTPFELTANYLHMHFRGACYLSIPDKLDLADIQISIQKAIKNIS